MEVTLDSAPCVMEHNRLQSSNSHHTNNETMHSNDQQAAVEWALRTTTIRINLRNQQHSEKISSTKHCSVISLNRNCSSSSNRMCTHSNHRNAWKSNRNNRSLLRIDRMALSACSITINNLSRTSEGAATVIIRVSSIPAIIIWIIRVYISQAEAVVWVRLLSDSVRMVLARDSSVRTTNSKASSNTRSSSNSQGINSNNSNSNKHCYSSSSNNTTRKNNRKTRIELDRF